jgi:hypothetical protein
LCSEPSPRVGVHRRGRDEGIVDIIPTTATFAAASRDVAKRLTTRKLRA